MNRYVLPDLPYDYGALEPYISGQIMQLHHDKHHRGYVDGANKALEQLQEALAQKRFEQVGPLEQALAFNVSGHILHSLYWQNLAPRAGGQPGGELAAAIDKQFGNFAALQQQISTTASTIMGSGWAALMWDALSGLLVVTQIHDHQSSTIQGAVPLLVLDAWEHAYYLQYQNVKAKYIEAFWSVCNWTVVARRFAAARTVKLAAAA
jgi:superoxide dismutase, Fe-Mn family